MEGLWRGVSLLLVCASTAVYQTSASDCESENWRYDERLGGCLNLSDDVLSYTAALKACGVRGGRLFTPQGTDDLQSLEKLFGPEVRPSPYWTEYLLVRLGVGYRVFEGSGVEVALSSCPKCHPLLGQASYSMGDTEGARICAVVYTNDSLTWALAGCADQHRYLCYHPTDSEESHLAARDIAAIAVGAFILTCFFVTLAIDFCLHMRRERRKNLNNNIVLEQQDEKKLSPLDFSVSNLSSTTDLIPTNVSLSHV